jgi:flagellar basal body rod protein FlgC
MQINNNINSMMQLEKKLEKSADELSKLGLNNDQLEQNSNEQLAQQESDKAQVAQTNITQEMVNQIQIPLAYTANAEVISTQNSIAQTVLDIKA